jgi:hypothetical protein
MKPKYCVRWWLHFVGLHDFSIRYDGPLECQFCEKVRDPKTRRVLRDRDAYEAQFDNLGRKFMARRLTRWATRR